MRQFEGNYSAYLAATGAGTAGARRDKARGGTVSETEVRRRQDRERQRVERKRASELESLEAEIAESGTPDQVGDPVARAGQRAPGCGDACRPWARNTSTWRRAWPCRWPSGKRGSVSTTRSRPEMARAYVIGLTGNIATGKSTVAAMLRALGADVLDADKLAHRVMRAGTRGASAPRGALWLPRCWPGRRDRPRAPGLDRLCRSQGPGDLECLRAPGGGRRRRCAGLPRRQSAVLVVEAIKLLEAEMDRYCQAVWVVTRPAPATSGAPDDHTQPGSRRRRSCASRPSRQRGAGRARRCGHRQQRRPGPDLAPGACGPGTRFPACPRISMIHRGRKRGQRTYVCAP